MSKQIGESLSGIGPGERVALTRGRERSYSWLASFYLAEPNCETLKALSEPRLREGLALIFNDQPSTVALSALTSFTQDAVEGAKDEFYSLFVVPLRGTYIPPYESCFRERSGAGYGSMWGKTTEEVLQSYHRAGFEVSYPRYVFAPDHIGLELTFMSELCSKEVKALNSSDEKGAEESRAAQSDFLRNHILEWVPHHASATRASSASKLYKYVSFLTEIFVHKDCELLPSES